MVWLRAPTTSLWECIISVNSVSKLATGTGDRTDPTGINHNQENQPLPVASDENCFVGDLPGGGQGA